MTGHIACAIIKNRKAERRIKRLAAFTVTHGEGKPMKSTDKKANFFKEGIFDWQFGTAQSESDWKERVFNKEKYWGGFPEGAGEEAEPFPDWAVGPFVKHGGNPVFRPNAGSWDRGRFGGGVHNGSVIKKGGLFYYIYRGEMPLEFVILNDCDSLVREFDYICDIGIAVSEDGIHFHRDTEHSPLFRKGGNEKYSFEDVCCVSHGGKYYLFCNRWNWRDPMNTAENGVFLALSDDLLHWEEIGIVFKNAPRIHRNACVVQNSDNEAVRINGKFFMYINDGLVAESEDMLNWTSREINTSWPGGEGCFALYRGEDIVLFTGGHHTGHFYAIGEVRFSASEPTVPTGLLNFPAITADSEVPYEAGFSCDKPDILVSNWRDTVFFTGLTEFKGKYYVYYGGSEYYTCLAVCDVKK